MLLENVRSLEGNSDAANGSWCNSGAQVRQVIKSRRQLASTATEMASAIAAETTDKRGVISGSSNSRSSHNGRRQHVTQVVYSAFVEMLWCTRPSHWSRPTQRDTSWWIHKTLGVSVKPRPHQQQCRSNIVECYKLHDSFDKVECCTRFSWNFVISTKSKQIEHVESVSTLSKWRNFTKNSFDVVAKTATMSKKRSTLSKQHSTLSKEPFDL